MGKPKLKLVEPQPVDIGALIRTDIMKRDWSACHIAGDHPGRAVDLPPSRKWKWFNGEGLPKHPSKG